MRVCAETEAAMPAERGTAVLCDLIDLHGEALVSLIEIAEAVTSDGLVTPDECRLLEAHYRLARQSFGPLPTRAASTDDAMRLIGAAAGAGMVSPWVERIAKEAAADLVAA